MKKIITKDKIYLLHHIVWIDREITKPKFDSPNFHIKFTEGNYKTIQHPSYSILEERHKALIEFLDNSDLTLNLQL